ncbi:MAG: DNA polymerase I [Peptostreptococcaceae bacterium]|nr:DNA polymerase I [Peptostreptococcaceae bacterium]
MENLLIIIDGNSLMNRAFYGLPELMNKKGMHTNAIFGFANIIFKLKERYQPSHMSIAFDMKAPTFRHLQYKEYKGTRKGMPEELARQVQPIKELVDAFGIHRFEMEGFEADDIIGTLAKYSEKEGFTVYIITGDKDALQLASERTKIMLTKKGISELDTYGEEEMKEQYGITPTQFIDLKGLMGDSSDNIPGVAGIGEKTGLKLLQEYGSIENIYAHIDDIKGALRKKLESGYADALLSKNLATIVTDMPLEISMEELLLREEDIERLTTLFNEWEFGSLLPKLGEQKVQEEFDLSVVERICEEDAPRISSCFGPEKPLLLKAFLRDGMVDEKRIRWLFIKAEGRYFALEEEALLSLKEVLEDRSIPKYGHNMKEDCLALRSYGISLENIRYDAAICEYLIDSTSSHYQIGEIAAKYSLGALPSTEEWLGKGKNRKNPEEISFEEAARYHIALLDIVEESVSPLLEKIGDYRMEKLMDEVEIPLIKVLADMEYEGVAVDISVLEELSQRFRRQIEDLEEDIYELAGCRFNILSPKQLGEVLFEKLGLPVIKKTKTGYSTNAEVLEALHDRHPIIEKISAFRQFTKLQSTYVDGLLKIVNPKTGRIHSSFNQTITTTGRISSTEPNMQNIPVRLEVGRELRKVFVAAENCLLVDADYSQIELRVLAHMAEEENLIEAFSKEADIHTSTASEVFGIPINQVSREQRSAAKAVNFGIVYGISDFGLSNNLGVDIKTAKHYIESYFERYPKIREYMEEAVRQAEKAGYVETLLARRRYIPEVQSKNFVLRSLGKRLAMNTPIQGSAADIIKIAMVRVYDRLRREDLRARLILQVHDELMVETPLEEVEKVKQILKQEMEEAASLRVRLLAEVEAGKSWYETK